MGKDQSESEEEELARERINQRVRRRSLQGKGPIREQGEGACKGNDQSESKDAAEFVTSTGKRKS